MDFIQELPDLYHKDICRVMVKDPYTIFAYWEISNRKKWMYAKHYGCDWGFFPLVLRIYDVTNQWFEGQNANSWWDIEVGHVVREWTIPNLAPAKSYVVDIGIRDINGNYVPVIRSNPIETPRDCEGQFGDPIVAVPQITNTHARIDPVWFENFSAYKIYEI